MKTSICGLNCGECMYRDACSGCSETDGKPFGGVCMVARCCSKNRSSVCGDFSSNICTLKKQCIDEFNALGIDDMEEITDLYALVGSYINLMYTLPSGQRIRLWDDNRVYLGNQLPKKNSERFFGLTADEHYLLVCEYGADGKDAEIIVFKKRTKRR